MIYNIGGQQQVQEDICYLDPEILKEEIQCCNNDEDIMVLCDNILSNYTQENVVFRILKGFHIFIQGHQSNERNSYNLLVKELAIENQKLRQSLKNVDKYSFIQQQSKIEELKNQIKLAEQVFQEKNQTLNQKDLLIKLYQGDLNQIYQQSLDDLITLENTLKDTLKIITEQKTYLQQRQTDSKKDSKLCVICMNKSYCILLKPCGHVCVCEDCIPQITKCPIDREVIAKFKKVFLS